MSGSSSDVRVDTPQGIVKVLEEHKEATTYGLPECAKCGIGGLEVGTSWPCLPHRLAKEAYELRESLKIAMRALESTLSNYHGISGLDDDCEDDEVVYETISGRLARGVAAETERDWLATALQQQEAAYSALEAQYLAVSDAHAHLVDRVSALAAEAIQ